MSNCVSVAQALRSYAPLDRRGRLHPSTRKPRAPRTPAPIPMRPREKLANFLLRRLPAAQPTEA